MLTVHLLPCRTLPGALLFLNKLHPKELLAMWRLRQLLSLQLPHLLLQCKVV
jgi:hypothetical protein